MTQLSTFDSAYTFNSTPSPVFSNSFNFIELEERRQNAIILAAEEILTYQRRKYGESIVLGVANIFSNIDLITIKSEKYLISDLIPFLKRKFNCSCNLSEVDGYDRNRIETIMHYKYPLPFVSFFTKNLHNITHFCGDGWHRFVAAKELNRLYFEIIYVSRTLY